MYLKATGLIAVALWASVLNAQAPPETRLPPAIGHGADRAVEQLLAQQTDQFATLRGMLTRMQPGPPAICSIRLLVVKPPKDLELMPVLAPPFVERMPVARVPAPPCPEEIR